MKRYTKRRFFKRWYDSTGILEHRVENGWTVFTPQLQIHIYGYEDDSEYPDDWPLIDEDTQRGRIFGRWFSEVCEEGELGTTDMEDLQEITEQEFEQAKQKGWKV